MQSGRFAFCNWFFYSGIRLFHRGHASIVCFLHALIKCQECASLFLLNAKRALFIWEGDLQRKIPGVHKVHLKGC